MPASSLVALPQLFAWSRPTFDAGILLTCTITGMLVLSDFVASIMAIEKTIGGDTNRRSYDRGATFTGIADIMAGVGATMGFVLYHRHVAVHFSRTRGTASRGQAARHPGPAGRSPRVPVKRRLLGNSGIKLNFIVFNNKVEVVY